MPFISLDADIAGEILSHLDRPSLLSICRTCRALNADATPFLLRHVALPTSPKQALSFLTLAARRRERCCHIRTLKLAHWGEAGIEDDDEFYVAVARLLADVLERATNLHSLAGKVEVLIAHEPRIVSALVAHKPWRRLAFYRMGRLSCEALRSITCVQDYLLDLEDVSGADFLFEMVQNSAEYLQSLTVYGVPVFPSSQIMTKVFPHLRDLRLESGSTRVVLSSFGVAFPHLEHLHISMASPLASDTEPHPLHSLHAFSGRTPWLSTIARIAHVRHLRLYDWVTSDAMAQSMFSALRDLPIEALRSRLEIKLSREEEADACIQLRDRVGVSCDTLAGLLRHACPRLQYLDLTLVDSEDKALYALKHFTSTYVVGALGYLAHLKYLAVRAACSTPFDPDYYQFLIKKGPLLEPAFLARTVVEAIPSLTYFELDVPPLKWKDMYWRVERTNGVASLGQVSCGEARSAREVSQGSAFTPSAVYTSRTTCCAH